MVWQVELILVSFYMVDSVFWIYREYKLNFQQTLLYEHPVLLL